MQVSKQLFLISQCLIRFNRSYQYVGRQPAFLLRGPPGNPGRDGRDGRDGSKGEKGNYNQYFIHFEIL